MAVVRSASPSAEVVRPLADVEEIKRRLLGGESIKATPDQPTIHQQYSSGLATIDGKQVPCLIVAIPLDQSFGDLRIKPERYDENQGKWLAPSLQLTISATCPPDAEPPSFTFTHVDGSAVKLAVRKGLTMNVGLVGAPKVVEASAE